MVGAEPVTQALASTVPLAQTKLQRFVYNNFAHAENGRVIVIDPDGTLIADSTGAANLGTVYATSNRPSSPRSSPLKHRGRKPGTATPCARRSWSPRLPSSMRERS